MIARTTLVAAFVLALVVAPARPSPAQPPAGARRIAVLTPALEQAEIDAFRRTLHGLGYTEGTDLALDVRSADRKLDRLPTLAKQIVAAGPAVIVAVNTPGTQAAIGATRTIPIVMVAVGDPIATGFVRSLAHPGGNVTGISNLCGDLAAKRLALLKEAVPAARRIAVLLNPNDPITVPQVRDAEEHARVIGVEARTFPVRSTAEVRPAFERMLAWHPDAAMWLCGQQAALESPMIALAIEHRLPLMAYRSKTVRAGALLSYATETVDLFTRAAVYVDKILKGARPEDLPVEEPTKLQLTVNLKTAQAIGLTLPASVVLRADQVIQ